MLGLSALTIKTPEKGKFAEAITDAMEKRDMDLRALAKAIGSTYEHSRKLTHTLAYPSKVLLTKICKALHLDYEEMYRLVVEDKLKGRYHNLAAEIYGKNPRFESLERTAQKLTDEQLNLLVNIAKGMAKSNRA